MMHVFSTMMMKFRSMSVILTFLCARTNNHYSTAEKDGSHTLIDNHIHAIYERAQGVVFEVLMAL
jgi:hypothetical protein